MGDFGLKLNIFSHFYYLFSPLKLSLSIRYMSALLCAHMSLNWSSDMEVNSLKFGQESNQASTNIFLSKSVLSVSFP
jgi:hypothetical protein